MPQDRRAMGRGVLLSWAEDQKSQNNVPGESELASTWLISALDMIKMLLMVESACSEIEKAPSRLKDGSYWFKGRERKGRKKEGWDGKLERADKKGSVFV